VPSDIHTRELMVECFDERLCLWYFCARLHGIEHAITWAAAFREVKDQPSRIVNARPERRPALLDYRGLGRR
jgi:hypothetical protein